MSSAINSVQHNMAAMFANRQLGISTDIRKKSSEKLSTGYRINRAADDAAGLSISEKMRRQIRGLQQGSKNVQDGISLLQVADGALAEVHDMLHRMNELTIKAATATLQDTDREYIQDEVDALVEEIDRVGVSTTFNERSIFGDLFPEEDLTGSITRLVSSPAADTGKLSEAYLNPADNKYYPAATMDFSGINASNIGLLNGNGFSFTCAQSCSEVFQFTFDTSTNESHIEGLQTPGRGLHHFIIGIKDCRSGSDVLDAVFNYAKEHPMSTTGVATTTSVPVSHSNTIVRTGSNTMTLWGNIGTNRGYPTAEGAKNHRFSSGMGLVDCSSLTSEIKPDGKRTLWIQTGTEEDHGLDIRINRMDGDVIGVRNLNVSTQTFALNSIDRVKNAIQVISRERALLGAQQNRLEHTLKNNNNTIENTMYSESRIRDTDMADEMVRNSNSSIIIQAGQAMLAQANQASQGTLTFLS